LKQSGFSSERMVATFGGILALNYGWSAFASAREGEPEQGAAQVRAALAALSNADFPLTVAVADEMAGYGSDRHYDLVMDQFLAGVRAAPSSNEIVTPGRPERLS